MDTQFKLKKNLDQFEEYLFSSRQLAAQLDINPAASQELLHLIETSKDKFLKVNAETDDNVLKSYQEFFIAEYAYYSNQYERALKHYLQAKDLPYYEFFCFRASSHIAKKEGALEKALSFAEKAFSLVENDFSLLMLYSEILHSLNREELAKNIIEKASLLIPKIEYIQPKANSHDPFSMPIKETKTENLNSSYPEHLLPETHFHRPLVAEAVPNTEQGFNQALSQNIIKSIREHHQQKLLHLKEYLAKSHNFSSDHNHTLCLFQGWDEKSISNWEKGNSWQLLRDNGPQASQGFFIRWNGKGIAVNPGKNFLNHFHEAKHHIQDIDYIVVVNNEPSIHNEVREIYELNFQLNQVSERPHFINYYLNHYSYQILSSILKPRYKQEKHAVHLLELYIDSEEEKIDLSEDIRLHYFLLPTTVANTLTQNAFHNERNSQPLSKLGIRFELTAFFNNLIDQENENHPSQNLEKENQSSKSKDIVIGYIEGVKWTSTLANRFLNCDLMIVGVGNTSENDLQKISYMESDMGYFGTLSLLEKINPKIFICTSFGGKNGDIRFEFLKKLRQERVMLLQGNTPSPAVLPGEIGLQIDLKNLKLIDLQTREHKLPEDLSILRQGSDFSRLLFLHKESLL